MTTFFATVASFRDVLALIGLFQIIKWSVRLTRWATKFLARIRVA